MHIARTKMQFAAIITLWKKDTFIHAFTNPKF